MWCWSSVGREWIVATVEGVVSWRGKGARRAGESSAPAVAVSSLRQGCRPLPATHLEFRKSHNLPGRSSRRIERVDRDQEMNGGLFDSSVSAPSAGFAANRHYAPPPAIADAAAAHVVDPSSPLPSLGPVASTSPQHLPAPPPNYNSLRRALWIAAALRTVREGTGGARLGVSSGADEGEAAAAG